MKKLFFALLLLVAFPAIADQYLYPYGWSGGYGATGQCLVSNGSTTQPSFQSCGSGSGGTVSSIGLSAPSWLTVSGSPVTTSGVLALSATTGQAANSFLATPSGSTGAVDLRTITLADLPIGTALTGGANTFTGDQTISEAEPRALFNETDQGTDLKKWDLDVQAGILTGRTRTDVDGAGVNWLAVTRGTTTNVSNIALGNSSSNPTYSFLGTGGATFTAGITASNFSTAGRYQLTAGNSANGTGLYSSATNKVDISTNSTNEASFSTSAITFGETTNNPTFTFNGTGLFTVGNTLISSSAPSLRWLETDQGSDLKNWDLNVNGGTMALCTATDAASGTCVKNAMTVVRGATTAIGSQTFGNATDNPSYSFLGTGAATFGGGVTATGDSQVANLNITGTDIPTVGLSKSGGGSLLFSAGSAVGASVSSGAQKTFTVNYAMASGGTKPTVTGCSNSTTLGGAVAGSYVSGTTGTCTVTITLPAGVTSGYACFAHDDTTAADYIQSAIVTATTTLTISGTTVSGDKITWACPMAY